MGSCLSVRKDPVSAAELRLSVGPNLLTGSTVKPEVDTVNGGHPAVADVALKPGLSSRFRSAGSKDDAFFDSQPWLESDGEDDFLSVNGDFTPSRGSTPLHHKFLSGIPTVNNSSVLEETFNPVKKRLSELFKESLRHQNYTDYENEADFGNVKTVEDMALGQSQSTNEIDAKSTDGAEKERAKSAQCCLPSFNERKQKRSPVIGTG